MSEPGWYVDHQNPGQWRYFDGTAWTDHVQPMPTAAPPSAGAGTGAGPPIPDTETTRKTTRGDLLGLAVIGLFVGVMFGGFLFNGIGAITPTTDYAGTVERVDIEYSRASDGLDRRIYVLEGSTDGGGDWRIIDEDAYRVLEAEGYPQDVVVAMGDWSDSAERVTGASFTVDHQSTGARIGWATALGVMAVASLVGAFFIARGRSGGVLGALVFLIALSGPGAWLGFQAFQWVQSP